MNAMQAEFRSENACLEENAANRETGMAGLSLADRWWNTAVITPFTAPSTGVAATLIIAAAG